MQIRTYLETYGREVVSCQPHDTTKKLAAVLVEEHIGAMPVCEANGELVGIVSERDLVRKLNEVGGEVMTLSVRDLMTPSVKTCTPDEPMARARQLMHQHGFRHVPVVEDHKVVGMISVRDALKLRLDQKELEVNVLKDSVIAARNR